MTSDLREELQHTLGQSYTLEQELGGGGMSRVFVATDRSLGRQVVVKVLPGDMAAEVRVDRFRREIQLAAHLQHPHIVPLLSAGETNGLPFFVMPFVRGESLRERLNKVGEFPIPEAVRILREVASALAYAHENGIVHRDIKPENVLISGGSAMVTDFGVAKALASSIVAEPGSLTSVGVAIGTPAYMAPEQGTADPSTDHRADIYSLGVMGYEMLAGSPPFSARSSQEMVAAHVTRKVEPITDRRPSVPPQLAGLIMSCLEKRPSDRPQTASDVVQHLDTVPISGAGLMAEAQRTRTDGGSLAGRSNGVRDDGRSSSRGNWRRAVPVVAAVALVGAMAVWMFAPGRNRAETEASAAAKMLAVLPFENLGRPENAYFADGMTEEVRGKLASLSGLMVIARSSSAQYKQTTKPAQQIAKELGVRYLLAGTIRTELGTTGKPAHVRVSPELIEVVNGAPVTRWQEGFDGEITDVFQVQADIAQRVVQSLHIQLGDEERSRLLARPTRNLAAYDAYLLGEDALSVIASPQALQKAARFYERAIALDTGFSQAFARLSLVRTDLYVYTPTQQASRSKIAALAAAKRAVALAPDRVEGRIALVQYYLYVVGDKAAAGEELRSILERAPNNSDALGNASAVARISGRWDEALRYARKAQALDPRSGGAAALLGRTLLALRKYDEARKPLDLAVTLGPGDLATLLIRAFVDLAEGDLRAAQAVIAKGKNSANDTALVTLVGGQAGYAWVLDDSQQRLLLTLSPENFGGDRAMWGIALAQVYTLRGNPQLARVYADSARIALESAVAVEPNQPDLHILRAEALAYLGRFREAEQEGKRAVDLSPISKDAENGAYLQHQLGRVYILIGEYEKALDQLEPLLRVPYDQLSPGWMRIDPIFKPLRGNPRYERLIRQ